MPRERFVSFGALSQAHFQELEVFLAEIVPVVTSVYGPVSVFEHGPSAAGTCIGCGVDYAHLHVAPVPGDLLPGAKRVAPNIVWNRISGIREIRGVHGGYWFVQQPLGSGDAYLGTCPEAKAPSQLFRKVIAGIVGRPEAFDWKVGSGRQLMAETVDKLGKCLAPA